MQIFEKLKSIIMPFIHKPQKQVEPHKKYYNSIDWGIYEPGDEDRHKGLDYLDEIGCRAIKHYKLSIAEIKDNPKKLDKIMPNGITYLLMLEPNCEDVKRIMKFDILKTSEVLETINKVKIEDWNKYYVTIIEQVLHTSKSFVGTVISDGNGHCLIETLEGTTNSQNLTSTGADANNIDRCFYSDFDTISEFPKTFSLMNHYREIADRCSIKPGYYEFVYGSSNGEEGLFFTFHSNNEKFLGPLIARMDNIDIQSEIRSRLCQKEYEENCL